MFKSTYFIVIIANFFYNMWTVKELLEFLQSNNKRGALLYANYMNKEHLGINIIKYLASDSIAFCFDTDYKFQSPMKVEDAIFQLKKYSGNSNVYFHLKNIKGITEYGIIRDSWDIIEGNIFLLIDKE